MHQTEEEKDTFIQGPVIVSWIKSLVKDLIKK